MHSDESDKPRRRFLAAIAGAFAAIFLTGIAAATIGSQIARHDSSNPDTIIIFWCFLGTLSAIFGAGMGIAGSARRLTYPATGVGSVILALFAWTALLVPVSALERQLVLNHVWLLAVTLAYISLCSYAGALAAGITSNNAGGRLQFSLGELLFVFVPFAVFMGFLEQYVKK